MRFPIFSHRANPEIDPWICKKKLGYINSLISERLADWINPDIQILGIKLRGRFLPEHDTTQMVAGSGFDTAWGIAQSGYAGPLCWQLKTSKGEIHA